MTMSGGSISGFELIEKVGQGGMGSVFKARQLSLDRMVALKILPPDLAADTEEVERFKLEARSAAKLKHSGIVQVYETGSVNTVFYIVMEFIDGHDVGEWILKDDALSEADTLFVADSVARALQYAWDDYKIIHRDIKPDNILIDKDGTVKLADLGLAKMVGHKDAALTVDDMCTPHYCSPEQAMAEKLDTCQSDIYSLGATMYHMVTGQLPFDDPDDPTAPLEGHLNDFLRDPRKYNTKLTTKFVLLLTKMLAKNPEHRYLNWKEVLTDIARVNTGKILTKPLSPDAQSTLQIDSNKAGARSMRISSGNATPRVRKHKQPKKKRSPVLLGTLGLLLVALAFGAINLAGWEKREAAAKAAQRDQEATSAYRKTTTFARENKREYDAIIAQFAKLKRSYSDTSQTVAINKALATAIKKRGRAIKHDMDELKRRATLQVSYLDIPEAISIYESYNGSFVELTRSDRETAIAALRAKLPTGPKTALPRPRPVQVATPATPPSLTPTPAPALHEKLLGFNQIYVTQIKLFDKQYDEKITGLINQYTDAITRLERKSREEGDLDSVVSFRDEKARFKSAQNWDAATATLPAPILKTFASARDYQRTYKQEQSSAIASLNRAYTGQIRGLISQLTTEGDITGAKALQDRYAKDFSQWANPRILFDDPAIGPES